MATRVLLDAGRAGALTLATRGEFSHARRKAVIALTHLRRKESLPVLREALNDSDADVRKIAVGAVSFFNEPTINEDLLKTLFDEDWQCVASRPLRSRVFRRRELLRGW
jgi:HEAT repeat protein